MYFYDILCIIFAHFILSENKKCWFFMGYTTFWVLSVWGPIFRYIKK